MAQAQAQASFPSHAGAVLTRRAGRWVPAHYGSAAGELAACVSRVGLADRSDLGTLSIVSGGSSLDRLLLRSLGHGVAPGGAVFDGGNWWCRSRSGEEVTIICPYARVSRTSAIVGNEVRCFTGAAPIDLSDSHFQMNVVGRRTGAVLRSLGVYGPNGDARDVVPWGGADTGRPDISWLLEGPRSAIAIVANEQAARVNEEISLAGQPHGMCRVGLDAVERYRVLARVRRTETSAL